MGYSDYIDNIHKLGNTELHHVIALQIFGPDIKENIAKVLSTDHIDIHRQQNIPYHYRQKYIRNQRKRENGHIVLTEDDLKGRKDIQGLYLEGSRKLPDYLQDMNSKKIIELLGYENKVNTQLGIECIYPNIKGDLHKLLISNHDKYIQAQIIRSNHIYKMLKTTVYQ